MIISPAVYPSIHFLLLIQFRGSWSLSQLSQGQVHCGQVAGLDIFIYYNQLQQDAVTSQQESPGHRLVIWNLSVWHLHVFFYAFGFLLGAPTIQTNAY